MKKTVLFFVLATVVVLSIITGCKHNSPSAPGATNTPNGTETYIALYTHTITPTHTVSPTITATPTMTATSTVTQTYTSTIAPTPIDYSVLVSVPGGTFTQTDGTNSFSHTISAFKMGKYQVTYDLWYTVYTWAIANGYTFANAGAEGNNGTLGTAPTTAKYQPVTTINWRDAIVWCNAYSQKSGLTPVYCSDASFNTPIKDSTNGSYGSTTCTAAGCFDNPYVNWNTNGFRLPTEGEYQYAASYKDGTNWTPYSYASGATADYTNEAATDLVGWDYINSGSTTHAVGGKIANALGIYDMSGNVWELCWDWYGTYPTTISTDYRGPASGSNRVMRGGYCINTAPALQVGYRYNVYNPYGAYYIGGFRFARTY